MHTCAQHIHTSELTVYTHTTMHVHMSTHMCAQEHMCLHTRVPSALPPFHTYPSGGEGDALPHQPGGPVTQGRDRRAASRLPSGQVTCSRNTSSKKPPGLPVTLGCWGQDQPGTLGRRLGCSVPGRDYQRPWGQGCPGGRGGIGVGGPQDSWRTAGRGDSGLAPVGLHAAPQEVKVRSRSLLRLEF